MGKIKNWLLGLFGFFLYGYASMASEPYPFYLFFFYILILLALKIKKLSLTPIKKLLLGIPLLAVFVLVVWDAYLIYYHIPDWKPAWETTSLDDRFTLSVYSKGLRKQTQLQRLLTQQL